MAKLVSKVYGDALFEAAQETKCLDETFEQVLALQETLKEHEDLIQLLNHPQVVKEENRADRRTAAGCGRDRGEDPDHRQHFPRKSVG